MAESRLYRVVDTTIPGHDDEVRLVEATSASMAVRHVVKDRYAVDIPSAKETAALMSSGITFEKARGLTIAGTAT